MTEICQNIGKIYRDYVGTGMLVALFLLAVLYLLFSRERPEKKTILGIVPCILGALFACPVFAWLVTRFLGDEIYYRSLWVIPLTVVIAYAGVKLILKQTGKKRLLVLAIVCAVLFVCGDYVYDNPYYSRAENAYHVPDTVVKLCDSIVVEGREVRAVFPADMVQYVRQYTPYICMPYGREMTVERWVTYNEMYEVYELGLPEGVVEAENLAQTARKYGVHFIVWQKDRPIKGDLPAYDYLLQDTIDGYEIYVDAQAYLGL